MNLVLILLQYYVLCSCIISFVDMLQLYAAIGRRSYLIPLCNDNIKLANILSSSLCDIPVCYYSEEKKEVTVRFMQTLFFGHTKGHDVATKILEILR